MNNYLGVGKRFSKIMVALKLLGSKQRAVLEKIRKSLKKYGSLIASSVSNSDTMSFFAHLYKSSGSCNCSYLVFGVCTGMVGGHTLKFYDKGFFM